eukprot:TRINITY_DN105212_c0_g1_i1.p1 TRINITY_DN105212_c0_g1~~TRINITY_DN105212_c0_g1_i1.p1  ORF type:complete len:420 (-),score=57.15 TRINITY_DN105212_c0_g1_i1:104-1363(-)
MAVHATLNSRPLFVFHVVLCLLTGTCTGRIVDVADDEVGDVLSTVSRGSRNSEHAAFGRLAEHRKVHPQAQMQSKSGGSKRSEILQVPGTKVANQSKDASSIAAVKASPGSEALASTNVHVAASVQPVGVAGAGTEKLASEESAVGSSTTSAASSSVVQNDVHSVHISSSQVLPEQPPEDNGAVPEPVVLLRDEQNSSFSVAALQGTATVLDTKDAGAQTLWADQFRLDLRLILIPVALLTVLVVIVSVTATVRGLRSKMRWPTPREQMASLRERQLAAAGVKLHETAPSSQASINAHADFGAKATNDAETKQAIDDEDLEETFHQATNLQNKIIAQALSSLPNAEKLHFYAIYKQAAKGDVGPRPQALEGAEITQWEAWAQLRGLPRATAIKEYIDLIDAKAPGWRRIAVAQIAAAAP